LLCVVAAGRHGAWRGAERTDGLVDCGERLAMNTKADNDILMVAMMNMLLLLMDIYITEEIPKREQLTERLR
jgi:hypothetical protein